MALFGFKKTSTDDKKTKAAKTEDKKKNEEKKVKKEKKAAAPEVTSMKDLYAGSVDGKVKSKKTGTGKYAAASHLLIKPLVTEKATNLSAENKYVFVVENKANKIEVAKAIESVYGVKPISVDIIRNKGKRVSRGRIHGQRKDWKKAIVTLAKGETITIYEGI
jgi:large subunit ribosomal protein L23